MSVTAAQVIDGAMRFLGILGENDTAVAPESAALALTCLNDFLNGLNGRGCVFENVTLALGDPVPIPQQEEGDIKLALALYGQGFWGRNLSGLKLAQATSADNRFTAAHRISPATRADSGLLYMPSQRRARL